MIPDKAFHFFLTFSHEIVVIPLLIIGYIGWNKKIIFHALCLTLVSIILNVALKVTFQVPFPSPSLNKLGFAFPSGHMQSSVVFYGYFFPYFRRLGQALICVILTGIGLSLVHFGYHTYGDVWGGLFVGCFVLFIYSYLQKSFHEKRIFLGLAFFSTLLI